jgi:hypothetical protein
MKKTRSRVIGKHYAGANAAGAEHQVLTIASANGGYAHRPCATCPWRVDQIGEFPAEAFRHSANTAYDMATHTFACHSTGKRAPATCAGFLLRGAAHNLMIRMKLSKMQKPFDVRDGGHELFPNYRAMAIANGVAPDDPVLAPCRD